MFTECEKKVNLTQCATTDEDDRLPVKVNCTSCLGGLRIYIAKVGIKTIRQTTTCWGIPNDGQPTRIYAPKIASGGRAQRERVWFVNKCGRYLTNRVADVPATTASTLRYAIYQKICKYFDVPSSRVGFHEKNNSIGFNSTCCLVAWFVFMLTKQHHH